MRRYDILNQEEIQRAHMETFGGYEHRTAVQYTNPSFKIVHTYSDCQKTHTWLCCPYDHVMFFSVLVKFK